jgi:predicted ATP-dependent serine protease
MIRSTSQGCSASQDRRIFTFCRSEKSQKNWIRLKTRILTGAIYKSNLAEREIVIDSMPPNQTPPGLPKAPTGIEGFDEITKGGLPRGQTTLIEGAAGTGKTIMALQSLAYAARFHNEPGIFVAFEERPEKSGIYKSQVAKVEFEPDFLKAEGAPLQIHGLNSPT